MDHVSWRPTYKYDVAPYCLDQHQCNTRKRILSLSMGPINGPHRHFRMSQMQIPSSLREHPEDSTNSVAAVKSPAALVNAFESSLSMSCEVAQLLHDVKSQAHGSTQISQRRFSEPYHQHSQVNLARPLDHCSFARTTFGALLALLSAVNKTLSDGQLERGRVTCDASDTTGMC